MRDAGRPDHQEFTPWPSTPCPRCPTTTALEPHIDAKTMEIHHDKHHQAYVTNLNNALKDHPDLQGKPIEELIAHLDACPRRSGRPSGTTAAGTPTTRCSGQS